MTTGPNLNQTARNGVRALARVRLQEAASGVATVPRGRMHRIERLQDDFFGGDAADG
jgi:hypothetical protein